MNCHKYKGYNSFMEEVFHVVLVYDSSTFCPVLVSEHM